MTNGFLPEASLSMPLNAAGSETSLPFFRIVQTGEHAV